MKRRHTRCTVSIIGIAVVFATACASDKATQTRMRTAGDVPAASGVVTAQDDHNGNVKVELKVENLAPPNRVSQGATTYVVWIKPRGADNPQNRGALSVGDDMSGTLETLTSSRSFDVMVTPEASGNVAQPSAEPVLTAQINR